MSSHKVLLALVLLVSMPPYAGAQKGVMFDGRPAVAWDLLDSHGKPVDPVDILSVSRVEINGMWAFRIPVRPIRVRARHGTLLVTSDRIIYQADPREPRESFDENRQAVKYLPTDNVMELETSQKEYYFLLESRGGRSGDLGDFPGCTNFLSLVFSDFPAAESQFRHLTRNLPPIQEADWHDFQPKAAAWRALPVKPPLNAETDRHRILAENALKEKNLDSAIQHYEDALEIQPTWPAGWFNLALLYAEQKNYADATDSMKHYLELVPDAPDAQQAREQMIIWEDKAKH